MTFVVGKVAVEEISSRNVQVFPCRNIPLMLLTQFHIITTLIRRTSGEKLGNLQTKQSPIGRRRARRRKELSHYCIGVSFRRLSSVT